MTGEKTKDNLPNDENGPPAKRLKVDDPNSKDATNGFNAATDVDNASDLTENVVPLLPRDCKVLLLDIEGCTTSISFVHDVLFPFAKNHLKQYTECLSAEKLEEIAGKLDQDLAHLPADHPSMLELEGKALKDRTIHDRVIALMNHDVKATGLKWLQGLVWKSGYQTGELKGHIYQDFKPLLEWCKTTGVSANIYSSGSIAAQKLLFGFSQDGDLLSFLDHHFDTTSGPKKTAASYQTIAKALNVEPRDICFISDSEAELVAAKEAGIGFPIMSVRPGNAPLTSVGRQFPIIYSLLQVCGSGK